MRYLRTTVMLLLLLCGCDRDPTPIQELIDRAAIKRLEASNEELRRRLKECEQENRRLWRGQGADVPGQ